MVTGERCGTLLLMLTCILILDRLQQHDLGCNQGSKEANVAEEREEAAACVS